MHSSETCIRASREAYFVWTSSWSLNLTVYPQSREDNACHSMLPRLCDFPSAVTPWLMQMSIFHPGWYWCLLYRCLGLIAAAGMGGISTGNYRLNAVKFLVMCKATKFHRVLFLIFFFHSLCLLAIALSFPRFVYLLTIERAGSN